MIAEIGAGLGSLKVALDIAKGLNALSDTVALNDAKIALQGAIIDAQSSLLTAQETQTANLRFIDTLKARIMELESWEAQKKNYELDDAGQGNLAFRLKDSVKQSEKPHWICPQCYEDGKRSILKKESLVIGRTDTLVCHRCGFDIVINGVRHPQNAKAAASRNSAFPGPRGR